MGMIANAVTPEDRKDMLDKYGFSSVDALNEYSCDRMQYLSYNSKNKVSFANSMWANSLTMTSASDYASVSNVLDKYYGAESRILDFGKSDVLSLINGWCSDKTKGLIPEFLKEKPSNQTQSMIINTLYFDCAWKQPFPKSKSNELCDFYDEYGQRRCSVHMMSNTIEILLILIMYKRTFARQSESRMPTVTIRQSLLFRAVEMASKTRPRIFCRH